MDKVTVAILATIGLAAVGVAADYLLKRASLREQPLGSMWFVSGILLYGSAAFGWVYVMRHLSFATIGVVYAASMVLLLALVGVIVLGESLRWQEAIGILLALSSIVLLARFA